MKTKIISISTTALLTLTLAGQTFAAAPSFTDLTDIQAKEKILTLQDQGYVSGVSEKVFAPSQPLTAAQGVQLLVNTFELNIDTVRFIKAPKASDYFTNADDNAWYVNSFIIASVKGLELPSDLDPNQEWTRETFTFYLTQAMEKYGNLPLINFIPVDITDENKIDIVLSGAIQRALIYGVVQLDAEGKFNPNTKITRAEAAEQVYSALEYLKAHPAPIIETDDSTSNSFK